ncbi:kinase-like domain-containing protein [Elsinoe ampelina]|uniref:Kinase-like domain-containing protein n=1 Tax=Elsinoe ampelina TaxID=302913 RepID=A0A6A6GNJ2_9PEZI|nr:kinase-like domain-containing protein [Elsinoe ampelina]
MTPWPAIDPISTALYTEFLGQKDLSAYRDPQNFCTLPADRVFALLQAFPEVLCYLVEQRVEHNDVKPENILINDTQVKLIDFGLATRGRRTGPRFSGTAAYVALDVLDPVDPLLHAGKRDTYAFMPTFLFALGWKALPRHHPFDLGLLRTEDDQRDLHQATVEETVWQCESLGMFDIHIKQAAAAKAVNRMSPNELLVAAKKTALGSVRQAVEMAPNIRASFARKKVLMKSSVSL